MTSCDRHKDAVLMEAIATTESLKWIEGQEIKGDRQAELDEIYEITSRGTLDSAEKNCRALLDGKVAAPYEDCWVEFHYAINTITHKDLSTNTTTNKKVIKVTIEDFDTIRHCPITISTGAVVGIITGAIVLLGLILLCIWKAIMMYLDKQELKAFNKDIMNNKFWKEENPLYTPAEYTTDNPVADSNR